MAFGATAIAASLALIAVLVMGCYPSITIGPDKLPDGSVNQPYSATLSATGEEIWLIEAPVGLPSGLSISHERGDSMALLAGTPTGAGSYAFTVRAYGPQYNFGGAKGERSYTVVIH